MYREMELTAYSQICAMSSICLGLNELYKHYCQCVVTCECFFLVFDINVQEHSDNIADQNALFPSFHSVATLYHSMLLFIHQTLPSCISTTTNKVGFLLMQDDIIRMQRKTFGNFIIEDLTVQNSLHVKLINTSLSLQVLQHRIPYMSNS